MPVTRRRALLVAGVAGVIGVAGAVWWRADSAGTVVEAGDATVLVSERVDYGMDAQGGGTVEVLDGCLGAGGAVLVWPHGTDVVDEDPLTVAVPGLGDVTVGDEIAIGGGFVHEPPQDAPRADLSVAGVDVPEPCTEHGVFLAQAG